MSDKIQIKITKSDNQLDSINRTCKFCGHIFSQRCSLLRHLNKNQCKSIQSNKKTLDGMEAHEASELKLQIKRLEEQFKKQTEQTNQEIFELKKNPPNVTNNNHLQIVCVGDKDNYLDMLTEEYGNFSQALEYIKDCALSNLSGDCKLIERIYLNNSEQKAIRYTDKNRTKVEYFNENEEKVIDTKEVFGRKIANNLQNSYLKGVNHLINENLENRRCPNKFLEEYDLQMWNQHIYSLSDLKYQKKIMNQLEIPIN